MIMRFSYPIICLLILASVSLAGSTFMDVDYPFHFDNQGYVQFSAHAGINRSAEPCNETSVTVAINGVRHSLDKFFDCKFSKFIFLPNGEHSVEFMASFEGYDSLASSYYLNVTQMPSSKIYVYSPSNGSSYRKDDMIFIDSTGVPYGVFANAQLNATIEDSGGESYSSVMIQSEDGVFKKWMNFSVPEDGNYTLVLSVDYLDMHLEKKVSIKVDSVSQPNGTKIASTALVLMYPRVNMTFEKNSSVDVEVQFLDSNGLVVQGAKVNMSIYRNGDYEDSVEMDEGAYTYRTKYVFEKVGNYDLKFMGTKGGYTAVTSYVILIGDSVQRAESTNFTVDIMIPRPEVYALGSIITARAKAALEGTPLSGVSMKFYADENEVNAVYDNYGQYTANISGLDEGSHFLKAIASYSGMTAIDYVEFKVSDKFLTMTWLSDNETSLDKGKPYDIKVDLRDETGETMSGAMVTVDITGPTGVASESKLVQDDETGLYKTEYYPSEDGKYSALVKAALPSYVSAEEAHSFNVTISKQEFQLPNVDLNTAVLIILGLAALIFVLALLKIVF